MYVALTQTRLQRSSNNFNEKPQDIDLSLQMRDHGNRGCFIRFGGGGGLWVPMYDMLMYISKILIKSSSSESSPVLGLTISLQSGWLE